MASDRDTSPIPPLQASFVTMYCSSNRWFIACAFVAVCRAASSQQSEFTDATCPTEAICPTSLDQKSAALLQVKKRVQVESLNTKPKSITAKDVNLTKEGYESIVDLCCAQEMVEFIKRYVENMGLHVCAEGGLAGLAIYHDCADDKNTYDRFIANIETARGGECNWLQDTTPCTNLTGKCPAFPNASLPPCEENPPDEEEQPPGDDDQPPPPAPNPTKTKVVIPTCCKEKVALLSTFRRSTRTKHASAESSVEKFDCAKYPGPIQVMRNNKNGVAQHFDVKKLDIPTGTYELIYSLHWSAASSLPKDETFTINGVAINPVDSKAYGAFKIGDAQEPAYLVRFDEHRIEFVAQLRSFSIVGSFSSEGDYYYICKGELHVARQVASMAGRPDHTDTRLANFTLEESPLLARNELGEIRMADIVVYHGDLEGKGTESEYIIGLDFKNKKLFIAKDKDDTPFWILSTAGSSETKHYGAGWNFQGRVYFSGNTGSGVYEIPVAAINVNVDTSVMLKKVGESAKTGFNDGMNCIEAESPFPLPPEGDCGDGYVEVPSNENGQCPPESYRA